MVLYMNFICGQFCAEDRTFRFVVFGIILGFMCFPCGLLSRHASNEAWSSHVVQTWISSNSSVFSLMSTSIRTKPSNVWTDFALLNFSAISSAVPFLIRMVFTALIISYPPVFIISYALIMIEQMQLFHHGFNLNNR